MSKVLVTGGAGFMGSHVAEVLVERGEQVVVLDDLSGGFVENIPEGAVFIEGSITDEKLVKSIFADHEFAHVYHLAAYAAEGLSHFIKKFNYENNLIGSVNLINASVNHNVKCFVFTSSIAVYGKNQLPMTEEMVPLPEDSYGIAKLAVEQELKISREIFGLDYIIFRPHNVYGERQNIGDRYRNVVGIFMNQIMQELPMTIFGDGEQTRAFTYIQDVASVIAEAPYKPLARNQVFNIGADTPYTVNELARQVANALGAPVHVRHLEERHEVKHAFASHKRLQECFGYAPKFPLHDGLNRMASWVRAIGAKRSKLFANVEIMKNMPKSWQEELLINKGRG